MGNLPRLIDVIVDSSAYSATGIGSNLDSINAFDRPALDWLLRKMNTQRIKVGYDPFHEWTMESANEIPLESITEHAQDLQKLAEEVRFLTM
ncbi:hypothetical protein N7486_006036 [Penicillium sp. IBT 16267x]|nr:hypothetical protein N7486_006036 [Penicillium sp. IBT 16267x]